MNGEDNRIIDEAVAWHAAIARDDMDWDGFTLWLEADARHRAAYDEVALADALIDEHRAALHPMEELAPTKASSFTRRNWLRWGGAAIAASLAALLALPQIMGPDPVNYTTGSVSRRIALDDGSFVLLAPHSHLTVEGRKQEHIALKGGAWFDIRHNSERPLTVEAGGATISDIGTRFDVQATYGRLRVEVGQGEVSVSSQTLSAPIRLIEGRALLYDAKAGSALVHNLAADRIGEWREGRLSYDSAPLELVAADLTRYAGVEVSVAHALRGRQFSGTLIVGDGETALRDLSQLMDVELRRGSHGYRLGGADR